MKDLVGLFHFCSCFCYMFQMAAIWAQSHFNHLPTFFLYFFLSSNSFSRAHTHSVFETCSYAVSFRPICFCVVHVSHKRFKYGKKNNIRNLICFLTNLLSLGLSWNVFMCSCTYMWENALHLFLLTTKLTPAKL